MSRMIVIPLGGTGERFKASHPTTPKAWIEVDHRPILCHVLDSLEPDGIIYIPYHPSYAPFLVSRVEFRDVL